MEERLTLPGDIPGLLRVGSPVVMANGQRAVVVESSNDEGCLHVIALYQPPIEGDCDDGLWLDLTDPTGRIHALWWLESHPRGTVTAALRSLPESWTRLGTHLTDLYRMLRADVEGGLDPGERGLRLLCDLCLHVAGRPLPEPPPEDER